jgi:glycosyltransferase involved in cell wall biosynthesis
MSPPLISIVTPCLNRAAFVREAVESVLAQEYPNFEHILIDGGSTDGTLELLRAYRHLRLVSEPDEGMYDAINKGIRMARGAIVGLLNTDDLYAAGCFAAVAAAFEQDPDALAVDGGITTFRDEAAGRVTVNAVPAIEPERLWPRLIAGNPVTNAWFFRPALFERVGLFDTRYRYSSDRFFLIRLALDGGVRPAPIPQPLYHYRQHSGSVTISTLDSRSPEYGPVRMKILGEDVRGLEDFLDRPALPPEVRRLMRHEHGVRCYRLAATAFYHRKFGLAWDAVRRGFRRNLLLPVLFVDLAARRLAKGLGARER